MKPKNLMKILQGIEISQLEQIIKDCFEEYDKNGFYDYWQKGDPIKSDLAEIGLFTTEISEGLEDIRKGNYKHLGEELSDIIIRVINFATRKDISIEKELIKKIKKNSKREFKHGKKNI